MTEQAWLTAMLGRAAKPPKLSELLTPKKPSAKKTDWQTMYRAAEAWAGITETTLKETADE